MSRGFRIRLQGINQPIHCEWPVERGYRTSQAMEDNFA